MTTVPGGQFSIMHVILEPRYSGAEMLVRDLVQIQAREGHRTSIMAFRPSQDNFLGELNALKEMGCDLRIPSRKLERWGRVKWVRAAVMAVRPDIIFAHSFLPSVYTRLALRFSRRPSIVTVLHTDEIPSDPTLLRLERLLYGRNACVVGVSPRSVENYRRRSKGLVPTRVVLNGIHAERFAELGREHRRWRDKLYGARGDEVIALQVGRISLQKQQHVSVEALIQLQAKGLLNIRLVLAGLCDDEEYGQRVLQTARDGGVSDRVQLAGPQGNIAEWLAGADVFLMPSAWEAHSVAALEALASGVYCVFSGIEAFRDLRPFAGVEMIGASPTARELGDRLERVVSSRVWDSRYDRDLSRYSIDQSAADYMRIAGEFGSSGSRSRINGSQ